MIRKPFENYPFLSSWKESLLSSNICDDFRHTFNILCFMFRVWKLSFVFSMYFESIIMRRMNAENDFDKMEQTDMCLLAI